MDAAQWGIANMRMQPTAKSAAPVVALLSASADACTLAQQTNTSPIHSK